MFRIIAVIPARGGSKRVPGKNIMDFCGKPMIAWTIEAAIESKLFDKIIVSTDSEEIAKIAKEWGAEVPYLRTEAANDFSTVSEATLHSLNQLEEIGLSYDIVIQLFAVSPLRNSEDIKEAYNFFKEKKAPFLVSCFKYTWMNPWWAVTLDEKNHPSWIFDNTKKRSQDLPALFCPTGAIWIANINSLKREKTFYGIGHVFWEIDWKRALDIDNYEDVELGKVLKKLSDKNE